MEQIDKIVAILGLLGSLVLVASSSRLRTISGAKWTRLAAVWAMIFILAALLARAGRRLAGA